MNLFRNIKQYLLTSEIKKVLLHSNREKQFISYDKSRNIGLLYKVGEEKDQIEFSAYVSRLQNEKKEIKALGIVGYKDIPHYCYPKLSYDYLTLTNLNWFRKPTGEKLADFVKKDFDILINFDTTSDLTLQYIAALSRAKCKVGVFNEKHKDIYDMMLNVDADYPFKELSEQYLTYINMFSQQK